MVPCSVLGAKRILIIQIGHDTTHQCKDECVKYLIPLLQTSFHFSLSLDVVVALVTDKNMNAVDFLCG